MNDAEINIARLAQLDKRAREHALWQFEQMEKRAAELCRDAIDREFDTQPIDARSRRAFIMGVWRTLELYEALGVE